MGDSGDDGREGRRPSKQDVASTTPLSSAAEAPLRPPVLFALFAPVRDLPGVGPGLVRLLTGLLGSGDREPRCLDLLWHLPTGVLDRPLHDGPTEALIDTGITLRVRIDRHLPGATRKHPHKVRCRTPSGLVHLVYFKARAPWLEQALPKGEERVVAGMLGRFGNEWQIVHPEILPADPSGDALEPRPVHPLCRGLQAGRLRKVVASALASVPALPEWLDPALVAREGWPAWSEAILAVQRPRDAADVDPSAPVRRRLAFDELLAGQLALALLRRRERRLPGRALVAEGRLVAALLATLPFTPTSCQTRALAEIRADMARPERMLRLLQGDVGSGKTLVALLAMLQAVEAGGQAVLMAPTELLARQHAANLAPLARRLGLRLDLLTGRERASARREVLDGLASGESALAVGTHALFQDGVVFRDLALAVIDEQHRFGVRQRLDLAAKGEGVDLLVMTATPIPRTLLLALHGDMASSELREKPAGRAPIRTRVLSSRRLEEVVAAIARALDASERVYWVCPVIEDEIEGAGASARFAALSAVFGDAVGLVHGRMAGEARLRVMRDFAAGRCRLLVATTVIEVGIDVPEATVMVVERAERFGLAQLHQLRGRVGRGARASACLLLYTPPLGRIARERLSVLRDSADGYHIAEADLRLRGPGDMLGTRQSGLPELRLADLAAHADLLSIARDDARLVLARDPELASPRGQALRLLLHLFERERAMAYLASG